MIFTMTSMICIYKRRGVYDGIHCVADLAPDGTLLRSYTWGSGVDNLLAVTFYSAAETNTLYAVTDPLGTVHALVGTNDTSQLLSLPASQLARGAPVCFPWFKLSNRGT